MKWELFVDKDDEVNEWQPALTAEECLELLPAGINTGGPQDTRYLKVWRFLEGYDSFYGSLESSSFEDTLTESLGSLLLYCFEEKVI